MSLHTAARIRAALVLILLLAACNLVVTNAPEQAAFATPQPIGDGQAQVQVNVVTATPPAVLPTVTPAGGVGQVIPVTVAPGTGTVQPAPAAPTTSNAVDWLITMVLVPAWNFLYTLFMRSVGTLFDFAGARGGVFAQVLCCIVPFIVALVLAVRYFFYGRRLRI